jgi:hypothetical protein
MPDRASGTDRACLDDMSAPVWLAAIIAGAVSLPADQPDGQKRPSIPLGTRRAPIPPGEGGNLLVTAPTEFCADATHEIEVRFFPHPTTSQPMFRRLAGPSPCRWEIEGLPAGEYDARIMIHDRGRIVATGRAQVARGTMSAMTLETLQVELEGNVTITGDADDPAFSATEFRIVFGVDGPGHNEWDTPLEEGGAYRVKLANPANGRVCARLKRTQSLNLLTMRCENVVPGLQRLDFDLRLLPGVIRIHVPPVTGGAPVDFASQFAVIHISHPKNSYITSFKLAEGLRAEYFGYGYADYEFTVTTLDRKTELASSRVTLSREHPVGDVTLKVTKVP